MFTKKEIMEAFAPTTPQPTRLENLSEGDRFSLVSGEKPDAIYEVVKSVREGMTLVSCNNCHESLPSDTEVTPIKLKEQSDE